MRSVVVLPQPDGPSSVVKLARGMSSETLSTAAAAAPAKRFTRLTTRTWASLSGIAHFAQTHPPSCQGPDDEQYADGHADYRHRKRRGAAPVEVVHQLKDGDRGNGRGRREQEDDYGQGGDGAHERCHQAGGERAAQNWEEHAAEGAQAAGAQTGRRFVDRAVDLLQSGDGGAIA